MSLQVVLCAPTLSCSMNASSSTRGCAMCYLWHVLSFWDKVLEVEWSGQGLGYLLWRFFPFPLGTMWDGSFQCLFFPSILTTCCGISSFLKFGRHVVWHSCFILDFWDPKETHFLKKHLLAVWFFLLWVVYWCFISVSLSFFLSFLPSFFLSFFYSRTCGIWKFSG